MMGWLIAVGVLLIVFLLPVCVRLSYDTNGANVFLLIGFLRIPLYLPKVNRRKSKRVKESADPAHGKKDKEQIGSWTDFLPLVKTVLELLDVFGRRLIVSDLELSLTLAGGDPCDLSINYGRAWAAIGNLYPHLTRIFVIKKHKVELLCDYLSDKTAVIAKCDISISFIRLLSFVVYYGIRGLKQYIDIMNKRKGGANT